MRLGWGGGVVYREVGEKRWCEAEGGSDGGVLGACEKLPWFSLRRRQLSIVRALELSEAEQGVDCSCVAQRACIQLLGIYISIA